jgi:hypothetical protein
VADLAASCRVPFHVPDVPFPSLGLETEIEAWHECCDSWNDSWNVFVHHPDHEISIAIGSISYPRDGHHFGLVYHVIPIDFSVYLVL